MLKQIQSSCWSINVARQLVSIKVVVIKVLDTFDDSGDLKPLRDADMIG